MGRRDDAGLENDGKTAQQRNGTSGTSSLIRRSLKARKPKSSLIVSGRWRCDARFADVAGRLVKAFVYATSENARCGKWDGVKSRHDGDSDKPTDSPHILTSFAPAPDATLGFRMPVPIRTTYYVQRIPFMRRTVDQGTTGHPPATAAKRLH